PVGPVVPRWHLATHHAEGPREVARQRPGRPSSVGASHPALVPRRPGTDRRPHPRRHERPVTSGRTAMTDLPAPERPLDLHGLRPSDLASRPSKVFHDDLGKPLPPGPSVEDWIDSLPRQLGANALRRVRFHLARAHSAGKTVVAAIGGHVIKTGCAPYLIDWVRRGLLKTVAMNG